MHKQDKTDPTGVADVRNGTGGNVPATRARERKANAAVQMRISGMNWAEVAEVLGYPSPRAALVATERALAAHLEDPASREEMRAMAGARLNALLKSVWDKATDPEHEDQLVAFSRAREVVADYRKLYGLDAPSEVVVHTPTTEEIEQWVANMVPSEHEVSEADIFDVEIVEEA